MAGKASGAASVTLRALCAAGSNLGTALAVCLGFGLLSAEVQRWVFDVARGGFGPLNQTVTVKWVLASYAASLTLEILLGPIFAAYAVYIGWRWLQGRRAHLYGGTNFALARYPKMFLPHLAAEVSIQLGMMVVIPGILFWMQYAFVDVLAALTDVTWPLPRSKKLTRSRRGTIFLIILLPVILLQGIDLAVLWALSPDVPWLMLPLIMAGEALITMVVDIAFVVLWAERTQALAGDRSAA